MASLGATSAALPRAAFPQAALGPAPQNHVLPEPTLPVEGVGGIEEAKPTPQFNGVRLEEPKDDTKVSTYPSEEEDETPGLTPLQAEAEDEHLKLLPEEEDEKVEKFDPQAAFEEQAKRIADLVDRFEEFLRKLDEVVAKATGEEEESLATDFYLQEKAEKIFGVLESTATALLEEANNPGGGKDSKKPADRQEPVPRPRLNVVY